MTKLRIGVVDVYVICDAGRSWQVLTLRRSGKAHSRSPGSWETVHGKIEPREKPAAAAIRELEEETGLTTSRLYSITTNPFYVHKSNVVQVAVAYAAFVDHTKVRLSAEHSSFEWLSVARASRRFTWPREAEALVHIRKLLRAGHAGTVEDVLRVH